MQLRQALESKTVHDLKQLRALTPMTDRSTRKADIVAAIADFLLSADLASIWGQLAPSVKKLEEVLLDGDWYSEEDDPSLERWAGGPIRPIRPYAWPLLLQVGGLIKRDGTKLVLTPRGTKALSQPIEATVKHLFERWQSKGQPDEPRRIDLIKGQTSRGVQLTAPSSRRAVVADALRAYCPKGVWLAIDELFRQMQMNGLDFEVSRNPWNLRAGERLICVAEAKLGAFRKGLVKLGFVLPGSIDV